MKTGERRADGYCSIHRDAFINIYDERTIKYDCAVCYDYERLTRKISQLRAAFEDLAAICHERRVQGEVYIRLENVEKYAEQALWP